MIQAVIILAAVAGAIWVVIAVSNDWSDYVVFGVLIATTLGAARAIYDRKYPTKKRAISRTSKD